MMDWMSFTAGAAACAGVVLLAMWLATRYYGPM